MERPLGETLLLVGFFAITYVFSIHATWAWKYRHLDYPNGFPAITGLSGGVELFQGILLAVFWAIYAYFFWRDNEPGGAWWLVVAGFLWIIQLFIITRHRMSWEEYWELKKQARTRLYTGTP